MYYRLTLNIKPGTIHSELKRKVSSVGGSEKVTSLSSGSVEGRIYIPLRSRDNYTSMSNAFNEFGYSAHTWEASWRDPPHDPEFGEFISQWIRKVERKYRYPRFHLDFLNPKVELINGAQVISAQIRVHLDSSRHHKDISEFGVQECKEEVSRLELALQKPRT